MAAKFKVGDLVWAKIKGFSAWPGQVIDPYDHVKRPAKKGHFHFVLFFRSNDFAWVPEESIDHYIKLREKYVAAPKLSKPFKESFDLIESAWQALPESAKKAYKSAAFELVSPPTPAPTVLTPSVGAKSKRKSPPAPKPKKGILKRHSTGAAISKSGAGDGSSPGSKKKSKLSLSSESQSLSRIPGKDVTGLPTGLLQLPPGHHEAMPEKGKAGIYESPPPSEGMGATSLKIGFLGLGIMGQGMVMNLLRSGHKVTVWNKTVTKTEEFSKAGAIQGYSPAEVVRECDITFTCVADSVAVRDVVFGNEGVLEGITQGKCYVEMSTVDEETVQDVADAVMAKGGTFLEAPVCGSRVSALEGKLVFVTAGDRKLHDDCFSCFTAMGKRAYYLSNEVGTAIRMKLVHSLLMGSITVSLAESMSLAMKVGLDLDDFMEVMSVGEMHSPHIAAKGKAIMMGRTMEPHFPLQHQQKDLRLVISMGDSVEHPLHMAAAANEVCKTARMLGAAEQDVSAVFKNWRR